jgi:hypothetical protein
VFGTIRQLSRPFHPWTIASNMVEKVRESGSVATGLFRGLPASDEALEWFWPQLLGVYEHPLIPTLERWLSDCPPRIVDVGAASGYYAVGFGLRCPKAEVIAYEANSATRERLLRYADRAGVAIDVRGECRVADLDASVGSESGLLFMDCEGAERELLGAALVPRLANWRVLVELHDEQAPGVGEEIYARFRDSHMIREIWTQDLKPGDFHGLLAWPLSVYCIRALRTFCEERRQCEMRWFAMEPR